MSSSTLKHTLHTFLEVVVVVEFPTTSQQGWRISVEWRRLLMQVLITGGSSLSFQEEGWGWIQVRSRRQGFYQEPNTKPALCEHKQWIIAYASPINTI